jgi:gluconate kinase
MKVNESFTSTTNPNCKIFVIFGIPGAGKTTIAKNVAQHLLNVNQNISVDALDRSSTGTGIASGTGTGTSENQQPVILHLDLDDCIPEWMRINFTQGIYPTLEQRNEFSKSCCIFVNESIQKTKISSIDDTRQQEKHVIVIVSFSFVNDDLRRNFRNHFPTSFWILISTNEVEAERRIRLRSDHFYNGTLPSKRSDCTASNNSQPTTHDPDYDNNQWKFSPVLFPHKVLNGHLSIEEISFDIVTLIESEM